MHGMDSKTLASPPPAAAPAAQPLDRTRQAAPQVFERLRDMIVDLELAPGTVLSRQALAERFGVSQTPVRDALIQLAQEGLVDVFPQHATVVSRIDAASAVQAHFLRCAIELEIVRTLAERPEPALVRTLGDQVDLLATLADDDDAFIEADRAFHRTMYVAAAVAPLHDLVRQRSGHIDRLRRLDLPTEGKAQRVVREHGQIVDAIRNGDPAAARDALRQHLSGTLARIDEIRRRHPGYVTG
jgi:GntR family transcriptional regulator, rspAB operon transcriptional repressor